MSASITTTAQRLPRPFRTPRPGDLRRVLKTELSITLLDHVGGERQPSETPSAALSPVGKDPLGSGPEREYLALRMQD